MTIAHVQWAFKQHLPPFEKLILLTLADMATVENQCWPSNQTLSDRCSCSPLEAKRATAALVRSGHIEQRGQKRGQLVFQLMMTPSDARALAGAA